ncbi:hypothetical protein Ait01nite_011380 [Actinoplanes italicus]|uniref:Uncharacterized protein n=1 Tax=Actinoplanes italicus TaxID=113567 RepID=A0A2T0KGL2_9ACTN|nr:hypothetical protein [Actinoplanes italicus]PRX22575.1 hypothetical protein CLV67_104102 [Actinoplanes italicus]GIE28093.1 hypothetical protein Ait01nite_011380 [Actinoplanes italicus]
MERTGAGDGQRPRLRIAGYVSGHAEPLADEEPAPIADPGPTPRPLPMRLPNISDYWPDTPQRLRRTFRPPDADTPQRRRGRSVLLTGLLAGLVITGTLLLTRQQTERPRNDIAAPPPVVATTAPATTEAPASVAPSESPSTAPTTKPATTAPPPPPPPKPPAVTEARFELVTGVTELSVRTADLDGAAFRVTTPKNSGLDVDADFDDGTLTVSAEPDGSGSGSGRVDVVLGKDIVWRLKMGAGVHTASFDLDGGAVRDLDLVGGAQTIDLELGRLADTLPILMAGGVHTWRISTSGKVPVKIALGSGAGGITLYGDDKGGVSGGETIRRGDFGDEPGLDIDAEAGIGFLDVARD